MYCHHKILAAVSLILLVACSSFGIGGIGIHWGNDFTLSMDDVEKEWLRFDSLSIGPSGITGTLPSEISEAITGKDLPVFFSRTDWNRTLINGGIKIFIDIIPILDAIELSTNFGLWEYEAKLFYPTALQVKDGVDYSTATNPEDIFEPQYDSIPLTLEGYGAGFGGLTGTPYMKLQFDLTVRKNIVQFPPAVKILKIYGGGGFTLNFATPIIDRELVAEALESNIKAMSSLANMSDFGSRKVVEAVVDKVRKELMTPHFGCHIDLGVMLKPPVLPLGIYVDGKFMIPFDDMDDLGGLGFLLNSGISLSI